ncbi:PREDICTED: small integral membrane protein 4 [Polistes canadensis]|uniref:small integral membrane protein 4 n=1 Tax=Polistes canadensis TaxID=91411 RepID=UPI000718E925|nr:PREDICTED: small integral membrane protein 4 [Polistes canadensis]
MSKYHKIIRKYLKKWPGEKTFGIYRFLPLFFVTGALLEYCMINWHVGEVNFYKVYKKRLVQEIVKDNLRNAARDNV